MYFARLAKDDRDRFPGMSDEQGGIMNPLIFVGIGEALYDVFENGTETLGGAPLNFAVHAHQLASHLRVGHDRDRRVDDRLEREVELLSTWPFRLPRQVRGATAAVGELREVGAIRMCGEEGDAVLRPLDVGERRSRPALQLEPLAANLASGLEYVRRSVEQLALKQEQMARNIAALQAVDEDIKQRVSSPPSAVPAQPVAAAPPPKLGPPKPQAAPGAPASAAPRPAASAAPVSILPR